MSGNSVENNSVFKVIHLTYSDNVLFTIKPTDFKKSKSVGPNTVMITVDDLVSLCAQKINTPSFELTSSGQFKEPKDKTSLKFVAKDGNFTITSNYQYVYDNSKVELRYSISIDELKKIFLEILTQMVDVYTFYRSNIDWTKNDAERKKSNEMGKRIDKIKKQVEKLS